jgi:hypothetical protein
VRKPSWTDAEIAPANLRLREQLAGAGRHPALDVVEDANPPITAVAIGERKSLSPPQPAATGSMPAIMATVVITMGRARLCPASRIAVSRGLPARISSMAKSTSRIEFLATMPISISNPITTEMENGLFAITSASAAPNRERGNAHRMVIGWNTRANSNTSTASTMSTPAPIASEKFWIISWKYSALPVFTRCTPCGRFASVGSA